MKTNKLLMICVALVLLFAAVSLSGCLGGDDANNTTPDNNTTVPENNTTVPENNTTEPENNTTTPSAGAVTLVLGEGGPEPTHFIKVANQKYSTSSLTISSGETVRFMNTETRTFRHLYHSVEGSFEDFNLDPRYSATLTFNTPGTYKVELLNYHTGESYSDTPQVLTVTVN